MSVARRLIINADDFGLTSGVNRGIAECYRSGIVTSSTLMANAQAFAEAAMIAQQNPKLSVGCHVVLLDGKPLLPSEKVSSLVLNNGAAFRERSLSFAAAALSGRIRASDVIAETTTQIRKLQAAGVRVSHLDTHKHAHIFPTVFKPLLQAARSCGVRAVRNPFVPLRPLTFAHLMRRPRLWTRYSEVRLLRHFAQGFRKQAEEAGMVTTDGSFGIVSTGALDERLFEAIIGCIPEGTWEFVCHPGYNDADLSKVRTRLRSSRDAELRVLTSERAGNALHRHGIALISYCDLI